jgi:4-hydroxy-tetrahydrodipicolinate synthase
MLSGIYSAMVTPFAADGDINEPALRAFIDQGIADGLAGVVVNGGTGEFATLTNAERRRVLEVTADQAAGRFAVIAQTGATSTREAIELSQHAEAHGAVALMLATPYYEPLTFDNVLPYFIDDAADGFLGECGSGAPTSRPVCVSRVSRSTPPAESKKIHAKDSLMSRAVECPTRWPQ